MAIALLDQYFRSLQYLSPIIMNNILFNKAYYTKVLKQKKTEKTEHACIFPFNIHSALISSARFFYPLILKRLSSFLPATNIRSLVVI